MKNVIKILEITVMMAAILFAMAACSDSGSGGGENITLPPAGDGSISFASAKTYDVYLYSNWNTLYGGPLITFTSVAAHDAAYIYEITDNPEEWEVKIDGIPRKLYLKLGTPKASVLDYASIEFPSSFTCTSGLKIFHNSLFNDGSGNSISWDKQNPEAEVSFCYANMDGTISGSVSYPGGSFLVNMALKQGWNTVINTWNGTTETLVTGTPDSSFKWILWSYW